MVELKALVLIVTRKKNRYLYNCMKILKEYQEGSIFAPQMAHGDGGYLSELTAKLASKLTAKSMSKRIPHACRAASNSFNDTTTWVGLS